MIYLLDFVNVEYRNLSNPECSMQVNDFFQQYLVGVGIGLNGTYISIIIMLL